MSKVLKLVRPPRTVAEVASINQADLEGEFARLPDDTLYWAWNYAAAAGRVSSAKAALEAVEVEARLSVAAQIEHECEALGDDGAPMRRRGRGQGPGGMTVDGFEALIRSQPAVVFAASDLREAEDDEARIRAVVETLRVKKDALVSLSANERATRNP